MKKKNIIMILFCCFFYCVTAFASDMSIEKFIGIDTIEDITKICIENPSYGTIFHIVDKNEIQQMYQELINMPIEKSVTASEYFELDKNGGVFPAGGDYYRVRIYTKDKNNEINFSVSATKVYNHDWVFVSGSIEKGKENKFCRYLAEIEKTKQKYFCGLEESDFYKNNVFVNDKKLTYQWGNPYFNEQNQLMVPFKELNTALNTQAKYDVKSQMVSIRKGDTVPLYGEITDEIVYVPIRALAELGGFYTYWDNELKIALVTNMDNIETWNKRYIYAPQNHIKTEEYTLTLPDTMNFEKSTLEENRILFYDRTLNTHVGNITEYTIDDDFDFKQNYDEQKIGSITEYLLDTIGVRSYKISNDNVNITGGSSKYADFEIWVAWVNKEFNDFNYRYYFFVKEKVIYVISFDENRIDKTTQEQIISTFEYE